MAKQETFSTLNQLHPESKLAVAREAEQGAHGELLRVRVLRMLIGDVRTDQSSTE